MGFVFLSNSANSIFVEKSFFSPLKMSWSILSLTPSIPLKIDLTSNISSILLDPGLV